MSWPGLSPPPPSAGVPPDEPVLVEVVAVVLPVVVELVVELVAEVLVAELVVEAVSSSSPQTY